MYIDVRLKLTSPFLGNKRTPTQVRRFVRNKEDLAIDLVQWNWALKEAQLALHIEAIDLECVRFPASIRMPAIVAYNRRWDNKGKEQQEMFEAVREGTVLTVPILITSTSSNSALRPPDVEELKNLLNFAGKMLGLSPWGCRFGYGRLYVLSTTEK